LILKQAGCEQPVILNETFQGELENPAIPFSQPMILKTALQF